MVLAASSLALIAATEKLFVAPAGPVAQPAASYFSAHARYTEAELLNLPAPQARSAAPAVFTAVFVLALAVRSFAMFSHFSSHSKPLVAVAAPRRYGRGSARLR